MYQKNDSFQAFNKRFIFCKISNIHIHLEVIYRKGEIDEGGFKCIIVLK